MLKSSEESSRLYFSQKRVPWTFPTMMTVITILNTCYIPNKEKLARSNCYILPLTLFGAHLILQIGHGCCLLKDCQSRDIAPANGAKSWAYCLRRQQAISGWLCLDEDHQNGRVSIIWAILALCPPSHMHIFMYIYLYVRTIKWYQSFRLFVSLKCGRVLRKVSPKK